MRKEDRIKPEIINKQLILDFGLSRVLKDCLTRKWVSNHKSKENQLYVEMHDLTCHPQFAGHQKRLIALSLSLPMKKSKDLHYSTWKRGERLFECSV